MSYEIYVGHERERTITLKKDTVVTALPSFEVRLRVFCSRCDKDIPRHGTDSQMSDEQLQQSITEHEANGRHFS